MTIPLGTLEGVQDTAGQIRRPYNRACHVAFALFSTIVSGCGGSLVVDSTARATAAEAGSQTVYVIDSLGEPLTVMGEERVHRP